MHGFWSRLGDDLIVRLTLSCSYLCRCKKFCNVYGTRPDKRIKLLVIYIRNRYILSTMKSSNTCPKPLWLYQPQVKMGKVSEAGYSTIDLANDPPSWTHFCAKYSYKLKVTEWQSAVGVSRQQHIKSKNNMCTCQHDLTQRSSISIFINSIHNLSLPSPSLDLSLFHSLPKLFGYRLPFFRDSPVL